MKYFKLALLLAGCFITMQVSGQSIMQDKTIERVNTTANFT